MFGLMWIPTCFQRENCIVQWILPCRLHVFFRFTQHLPMCPSIFNFWHCHAFPRIHVSHLVQLVNIAHPFCFQCFSSHFKALLPFGRQTLSVLEAEFPPVLCSCPVFDAGSLWMTCFWSGINLFTLDLLSNYLTNICQCFFPVHSDVKLSGVLDLMVHSKRVTSSMKTLSLMEQPKKKTFEYSNKKVE